MNVDGDQGSRSQMVGNLEELRARGQAVIESLSSIQLKTLLEVQKRLSALNGPRQRAFASLPRTSPPASWSRTSWGRTRPKPPARSGSILLLPPGGRGRSRARSTSRQRASRPLRGRSKKPVTSIK